MSKLTPFEKYILNCQKLPQQEIKGKKFKVKKKNL